MGGGTENFNSNDDDHYHTVDNKSNLNSHHNDKFSALLIKVNAGLVKNKVQKNRMIKWDKNYRMTT